MYTDRKVPVHIITQKESVFCTFIASTVDNKSSYIQTFLKLCCYSIKHLFSY